MTPLRFEQLYEAEWTELETLLSLALGRPKDPLQPRASVPGDRIAALYRRACEARRYNNPEELSLGERCLTSFGRNGPPPMLSNGFYNNN